jgi:hypothetical protein
MICLHCKRGDIRADDPWVPVAYLGKQQGWAHQSCQRRWKEQQRAHDAAIASTERKRARDMAMASAERKVRIKRLARIATMVSVFLFLLWLGWSAIAGTVNDAMFPSQSLSRATLSAVDKSIELVLEANRWWRMLT